MGFGVLGFGVWGSGFRVQGSGFGVWSLGFGVWGLGFRVEGLGSRFRVQGLGFGVWGLGFGVNRHPRVVILVDAQCRGGIGRNNSVDLRDNRMAVQHRQLLDQEGRRAGPRLVHPGGVEERGRREPAAFERRVRFERHLVQRPREALGFRAYGSEFRVQGSGSRVQDSEFRIQVLRFRDWFGSGPLRTSAAFSG